MIGRVLIIAGSDSGGGAGIQADIKTVTMLGAYAATAVTAITAQNTQGVRAVHGVPADMVREQIAAVMEDIGADAIKIGMLGDAPTIEAVANALEDFARGAPLVLDPVMIAKGGAPLLADDAVDALTATLLPGVALVTPNAPEAERITRRAIATLDDQKRAADALLRLGAQAALVKGGHLQGETVRDVLATQHGMVTYQSPRIHTASTHGTGCTLASAIAAGVAKGLPLGEAVKQGREYLVAAIAHAPGLGRGHGPIGHNWPLTKPADN